jgi:hypothetical protein
MAFGEVGTSLSKIKANSLNLAGTYGFSGTVTGLADETPLVLLSTFTSDGSDSNATFNSSLITSTYKEYLFVFNNIHPGTDYAAFAFNGSIDNGSNYNVAKTSSNFYAYHNEDDTHAAIEYTGAADTAQTTVDAVIGYSISSDNDHGLSGTMRLYNPSSTTFVKHFMTRTNDIEATNYMENRFKGGYFNTTSAINNIIFRFYNNSALGSSVEIQGGTIDLFGVV